MGFAFEVLAEASGPSLVYERPEIIWLGQMKASMRSENDTDSSATS